MKRRIFTIVMVLSLLLLFPSVLLAAELTMPRLYSDAYYAELPEMVRYLKQADGNRVILIGGSSVVFGTDTALLEQTLNDCGYDYTVCPMGLYAAVGTSAMLDLTEPELRPGDVVVLAFEPTTETMTEYFGATAFWKCAESHPGLLFGLSSSKRAALAGSYPGYLQERWAIRLSGDYPSAEGVYARSSFDDRCNMTYDRAGNAMLLGYDYSQPIDLAAVSIAEDFAEHVRSFCLQAEKKGARVLLSFCPMNRSAMADTEEETILDYFTRCLTAFRCRPISDPRDYILDSGWFYDTNFHLNTPGAKVRTALLAADLLAELGYYQAMTFDTVSMPASIAAAPAAVSGSEGFTFDAIADGSAWLVSGLEPNAPSELTVPALHEGMPVIGFLPDALKEASGLVQLRLPATIQAIPEDLFAACPRLTRLILEHTDTLCTITEGSFAGADQLRIYVPQAAYHLYRDGTGCQENQWQTLLERIYTY